LAIPPGRIVKLTTDSYNQGTIGLWIFSLSQKDLCRASLIMPGAACHYVRRLEEFLDCPVDIVSVGHSPRADHRQENDIVERTPE